MSLTDQYVTDRLRPYLASSVPNDKGWFDAHCPLHQDEKRSAGFNFEKGLWSCRVSCGSGTIENLIARLDARDENDFIASEDEGDYPFDVSADEIIEQQTKRKRRRGRPAPSDEQIAEWTERLLEDEELVARFTARRAIRPETLKQFEIGYSDDDRAYMIPIRDASGKLLNVRIYRMESEQGTTKIWSWGAEGMDASAIYPESVLAENDDIVIAEGEWDALINNQEGIPTVTGTTGAKQWMAKWNRKFENKNVYICYDRDRSGDEGAQKVADNLDGVARAVYKVELPLPWSERHGEDITDFYKKHKKTARDFQTLLSQARIHTAPRDGDPIEVSVKESYNPLLSGLPMSMTVSVVGKSTSKHLLPGRVAYSCNMNADETCHGCPMFDADGTMEAEIKMDSPVILRMREVTEKIRNEELRQYIGAHKCGKMETRVREWLTTEMLVVRTSLDHADDEGDNASRTVINVGEYATEANRIVRLIGTTYPSPKEQESVFQSWRVDPVESSLDTYELYESDLELLKLFVPRPGQSPLKKMGEIARDLSANVTYIVDREDLHIAMDLVWHSVIAFDFDGKPMDRGWLDLLVLGDARTGKSEVATKLTKHYGLGRVVSCESASIPGLLGAVKPMPGGSKNWTLEWGAIPLNDRRLVVLDEVGGLTTDQIGQLSSVRSSGKAEIIKAESEETNARTRLIWLSNPRDNRQGMRAYMYGIRAILPLIGNQEDVARFDMAMTVAGDDVPLAIINQRNTFDRAHRYTSEACHALLRWVWSRKRDQVEWEDDAVTRVYDAAMELGSKYVPDPPLIQGQNVRTKIARIAVAIAARTFSTDDDYETIIVKKIHVDNAVTFLDWIYGKDGFGYAEISRRARDEETQAILMMDEVKEYLYSRPGLARFLVASNGQFRRQQMEEMLNYSREEANLVIQKLSSMSMIQSNSDWDYRIQPHLNTILRETKE